MVALSPSARGQPISAGLAPIRVSRSLPLSRCGRDPDARFSAKHSRGRDSAAVALISVPAGWGFGACFHAIWKAGRQHREVLASQAKYGPQLTAQAGGTPAGDSAPAPGRPAWNVSGALCCAGTTAHRRWLRNWRRAGRSPLWLLSPPFRMARASLIVAGVRGVARGGR
jgi:hypothetical protein